MFSRAKVTDAVGNAIKGVTITNIKQQAGFKATDYMGLALQALGRRQLTEIYKPMLPQLQRYSDLMAQMDADKNEAGAGADELATDWGKLKDERELAELMHDATLAQMDPAKPYVEGDKKADYQALNQRYEALTPEAREVYARARDSYSEHMRDVRTAIKERIDRSGMTGERKQNMLKAMEDDFFGRVKGVYFPLARFGQYVVVVKNESGKAVNVSRAETMAEASELQSRLRDAYADQHGITVGKVLKAKEFVADRDTVGSGFMQQLYGLLDKQGMEAKQRAELEDALGQLYLSSMPDMSWAKHGIHRKGMAGFSQDARRAFAQNTFHGARYLAKLRYSDRLQDELTDMDKHISEHDGDASYDSVRARQVLDEMVKRHDAAMNPNGNPLSTALTSLGFIFHLGLSPASAMVNLTQTALVAYPVMGAKWGYAKASAALLRASKEAVRGKNDITAALNADERAAYDEAVRAGVIDVTMAHDLAGIAQGEDHGVMWKLRPVMKGASWLFHHAEKFNRQATFVAAYRLARDAGAGHQQAYTDAVKATYDGHFDYSSNNRPRIMQGNVARVLLLFKQFSQNMIYTLVRSAQQSLKAETPAARREARKMLAGLLTMHAMAAGTLGLPLVGTLLSAASMLGGSDDEPWDAQVALQNLLADTFGQKTSEVLAHGLSRLTPSDISGRVGLNQLIFPDIQEGLEGQRLAESAMTAALGPVAGIGVNVLKGMQQISEGQYLRGLESMLPSFLRAPAKAIRYGTEGVKDKSGVVIKDEVDLPALISQSLGFSPSEVRLAYEGKSAIVQHDRALQARHATLVDQYAMATMAGDEGGQVDAREAIDKFNEKNPNRAIRPMQLAQSMRMRLKRIEQAESGVYLPNRRRDSLNEGRFAVQD
ncbi:PLxRFG domain-containing protein [Comamonas testosteroni]|uniref:PLxRFG domain-containing protein n=1 Tax=Comamonas testosteroni TaxID=285 RepID=UPI0023AAE91E|nr:PLxRFG domain-containing protein [Comamonas testosteroni]WEE75978.1 PLxRFG domain-containing protein [Comamonas testosteroni]